VGLVARALELAGFPTLNLTAAYSITQAVNPPRAAFVDMPLGYTAGRPHEPDFQRALLKKAFNAVELIQEPGTIFDTEIVWSEDESWKEKATSGMNNGISSAEGDSREERLADPQYQYETDRLAVKIRE
tara:strand:+ start:1026 stop:1412 length:387 start_codon:yes stop_codon:yes gene_type:complete